jgi:D-threo-aldose 1-dehydrogenase
MHSRSLGDTDIRTSALGFGCATLFRVPQKSRRRRVLDAAFAAGVRHYDVAPIYGLGRAEAELAAFLGKRRGEVTITTKFGIEPTLLGRVAGRGQAPIRAALQRLPHIQSELQTAARGPNSGAAGRALYRQVGFSLASAKAGLTRSLRALNTDYVDIFVMHEPTGELAERAELADYLNGELEHGRIRAWGTAGEDGQNQFQMVDELPGLKVIQHRDNLFDAPRTLPREQLGRITFGILAQPLRRILSLLSTQPALARNLSDMLGADLTQPRNLVGLLFREALERNRRGPVLFTTTRADRISDAVSAVDISQAPLESEILQKVRDALGTPGAKSGGFQ